MEHLEDAQAIAALTQTVTHTIPSLCTLWLRLSLLQNSKYACKYGLTFPLYPPLPSSRWLPATRIFTLLTPCFLLALMAEVEPFPRVADKAYAKLQGDREDHIAIISLSGEEGTSLQDEGERSNQHRHRAQVRGWEMGSRTGFIFQWLFKCIYLDFPIKSSMSPGNIFQEIFDSKAFSWRLLGSTLKSPAN